MMCWPVRPRWPRRFFATWRTMVDLIPAPRASLAAAANREKKLADMLAALTDHYDYVFLECPPAQGLLTPNACPTSPTARASIARRRPPRRVELSPLHNKDLQIPANSSIGYRSTTWRSAWSRTPCKRR